MRRWGFDPPLFLQQNGKIPFGFPFCCLGDRPFPLAVQQLGADKLQDYSGVMSTQQDIFAQTDYCAGSSKGTYDSGLRYAKIGG